MSIRRGVIPGFKVYNSSDQEQTVKYNGTVYKFPPGKTVEVNGQDMLARDEYERVTEEALAKGMTVPNPHATGEIVANWIQASGKPKGLCILVGDDTDAAEMKEARATWIRSSTFSNKNIEARWLQRCIDAKATGNMVPAMPEYVEKAQDFLVKYRNGLVDAHKRFVVTNDGRSFDTKLEAKKHIASRYPANSAAWESLVNDTMGDQELIAEEVNVGLVALNELAAKSAEKQAKKAAKAETAE